MIGKWVPNKEVIDAVPNTNQPKPHYVNGQEATVCPRTTLSLSYTYNEEEDVYLHNIQQRL